MNRAAMSVAPDPVEPDRSGADAGTELGTFVDALIAEQRRLTAVERFSQRHEAHTRPALAPHYRDLIPLTAPRPGEQYGFEVDLDRCSGCKGCVTACHSLNGLDEGETWRSVGFLVGEKIVPAGRIRGDENPSASPMAAGASAGPGDQSLLTSSPTVGGRGNRVIPLQQTVTTACHHCVEPACMHGCPVLAYDKDPITGIVRHLDDQCIGCSYCILKCPYEVPRYSASRGIVRKCDLCHGRLAEGEAPACVQACPNEAIQIRLVRTDDLRRRFGHRADLAATGDSSWLPDAPSPSLTLPTTSYRTRHPEASLRAADHALPQPAHLHGPLVLMLVLTQAGLGGLLAAAGCVSDAQRPFLQSSLGGALLSLGLLLAGLAASALHLGQPRKAWRVFLGWRRSWLSREAIILGAAAGMAGLSVVWMAALSPMPPTPLAERVLPLRTLLSVLSPGFISGSLFVMALLSVTAQIMVYADTGRVFWSLRFTAPRFVGTVMIHLLAMTWWLRPDSVAGALLALACLLKLSVELAVLKHADSDADRWTALRRTAALQLGPLRSLLLLRLSLGSLGGLALPFAVGTGALPPEWISAAFPLLLLGELTERALFFTSVSPDRMPGHPG